MTGESVPPETSMPWSRNARTGVTHAARLAPHIFTRLGLWEESIAANLASAEAARGVVARYHPGTTAFDELHALDYLEYAYLQIGDQEKARKVFEQVQAAKTFDSPQFQAAQRTCQPLMPNG